MGISVSASGTFDNMERFLHKALNPRPYAFLNKFGDRGVAALSAMTPRDSGETATSWYYEIRMIKGGYIISWDNRNMSGRTPVAILLQYGHGTGTGGFVQGRDYINPAMQPLFDEMARQAWEEVIKA